MTAMKVMELIGIDCILKAMLLEVEWIETVWQKDPLHGRQRKQLVLKQLIDTKKNAAWVKGHK